MLQISNWMIPILTIIAILLIGKPGPFVKWGFLAGLLSEPFWIIVLINKFEWWLFVTVAVCSYSWLRGFLNYWFPKSQTHVLELNISGKPFWNEQNEQK